MEKIEKGIKRITDINIQNYGKSVIVETNNLTDKFIEEFKLENENDMFINIDDIYNSDIVVDHNKIDYTTIHYDELEWERFIGEFLSVEYDNYLVVAYHSTWDNRTGYKIVDNIEDVFIRDYECNQYVQSWTNKKKAAIIKEFSHDVPIGHNTIVIGLTNREYDKIKNDYFEKVIGFANKYYNRIANIKEMSKK